MKQMMRSELDNKVKPGYFSDAKQLLVAGKAGHRDGQEQEQDRVMGAGAMWARQPAQFVTTGSPTLTFED